MSPMPPRPYRAALIPRIGGGSVCWCSSSLRFGCCLQDALIVRRRSAVRQGRVGLASCGGAAGQFAQCWELHTALHARCKCHRRLSDADCSAAPCTWRSQLPRSHGRSGWLCLPATSRAPSAYPCGAGTRNGGHSSLARGRRRSSDILPCSAGGSELISRRRAPPGARAAEGVCGTGMGRPWRLRCREAPLWRVQTHCVRLPSVGGRHSCSGWPKQPRRQR